MSNYTLEHKPTSNHSPRSKYGASSTPLAICIHHWGADGQKHDNVVSWLRGPAGGTSNRGSSAHYVTSAGRVTKLAEHSRATWHSGSTRGNGEDIGIECRPEMSDDDWRTLVELCADIEEEEGRSLRYRKHSDHKATACPGRYSDRIGELVEAVNAEHDARATGKRPAPPRPDDAAAAAPPFPLPSGHWFGIESKDDRNHSGYWADDRPHIKLWQQQMKDRGWIEAAVTGRFTEVDRRILMQFQQEKGLRADGGLGRESWAAAWAEPVT